MGKTFTTNMFFINAHNSQITIGDREITYTEGFRLYFTTLLPNPTFSPEIIGRLTLVDFNITYKGLEDQLLAHVLRVEKEVCQINSLLQIAVFCRSVLTSLLFIKHVL